MPTTIATSFAVLATAVAAAPCATAPRAPESAPASDVPEIPSADAGGRELRIAPKASTWTLSELCDLVSRTTAISVLYDETDATLTRAPIFVCGTNVIRERDLVEWLQAALSFAKHALVPAGRSLVDGREQWVVMDATRSWPRPRPSPACAPSADTRDPTERAR